MPIQSFKKFIAPEIEKPKTPAEVKAEMLEKWKEKFIEFINSRQNKGGFDKEFEDFYMTRHQVRGVPSAWLLDYKKDFQEVWNHTTTKKIV